MSEFTVASRMQRHDLHKLHGLGNDFLVWFRPDIPESAPHYARLWCDRHTGLGADGLVIAIDDRRAPRFALFNADGSRAEVSGNGLRCFAHAIAAHRGLDEVTLNVETDAGVRPVSISGALTERATASVDMGSPTAGPDVLADQILAIVDAIHIDTVDLGNPHIVIEVADQSSYDMAQVGPAIEQLFMPTGINVHLVTPTDSGVTMRTWERGAGVTAACGSGACAAAVVAYRARPEQAEVVVEMAGGVATVEVTDHLTLSGPSVYIAAIEPVGSW